MVLFEELKKSPIGSYNLLAYLHENMKFHEWALNCTGGGGYAFAVTLGNLLRLTELGILNPSNVLGDNDEEYISHISSVSGSTCAVMSYHIALSEYARNPDLYVNLSPREWFFETVLKIAITLAENKIFWYMINPDRYIRNAQERMPFNNTDRNAPEDRFDVSYFSMNLTWSIPDTAHLDLRRDLDSSVQILLRCMLPMSVSKGLVFSDYAVFDNFGEIHNAYMSNNYISINATNENETSRSETIIESAINYFYTAPFRSVTLNRQVLTTKYSIIGAEIQYILDALEDFLDAEQTAQIKQLASIKNKSPPKGGQLRPGFPPRPPGAGGPGGPGGPGASGPGTSGPGTSGPGASGPGASGPGASGPGTSRPGASGPGSSASRSSASRSSASRSSASRSITSRSSTSRSSTSRSSTSTSGVSTSRSSESNTSISNRGIVLPNFVECDHIWNFKRDGETLLKLLNGLVFYDDIVFKAWINKGYIECAEKVIPEHDTPIEQPFGEIDSNEVLQAYSNKSVESLVMTSIWEEFTM
jgi:hypothetical protein